MATFTPGEVFVDGQQVNGDRLNNHVASAIPLPTFISERAETSTLDLIDNLLVWKSGTNTLEKIEATNLFNVPDAVTTFGTLTVKDQIIHFGEVGDEGYTNIAYDPLEGYLSINMGYSPVGDIITPVPTVKIGGDLDLNGGIFTAGSIGSEEAPQAVYMAGFNLAPSIGNPLHALSPEVGDVFYEVSTNSIKVFTDSGYVDIVTTGSGLGATRSYTKNLTFTDTAWNDLDVTRFPTAYIYKTPGDITVPAGETWHYTLNLAVSSGDRGYSGGSKWGEVIVYLDSTEIKRIPFFSYNSNPTSYIYTRVSLINDDTGSGKELKFTWFGYDQDGKLDSSPAGSVNGNITLDIELDADSEFKDANL